MLLAAGLWFSQYNGRNYLPRILQIGRGPLQFSEQVQQIHYFTKVFFQPFLICWTYRGGNKSVKYSKNICMGYIWRLISYHQVDLITGRETTGNLPVIGLFCTYLLSRLIFNY